MSTSERDPIDIIAEEIGERVMYRLCRRIEAGNGEGSSPEIVPHKLVIRQSVAKPAN